MERMQLDEDERVILFKFNWGLMILGSLERPLSSTKTELDWEIHAECAQSFGIVRSWLLLPSISYICLITAFVETSNVDIHKNNHTNFTTGNSKLFVDTVRNDERENISRENKKKRNENICCRWKVAKNSPPPPNANLELYKSAICEDLS